MAESIIELDDIVLTLSQAPQENGTKSVLDDMGSGESCLSSQADICSPETKGQINRKLNRDPELPLIDSYDPQLSGNYFLHILSSAIDDTDKDKNNTNPPPTDEENRPPKCDRKSGPIRRPIPARRKKPVENLYKRLMTWRLLGAENPSRESCCSQYCFLTWQRRFRRRLISGK